MFGMSSPIRCQEECQTCTRLYRLLVLGWVEELEPSCPALSRPRKQILARLGCKKHQKAVCELHISSIASIVCYHRLCLESSSLIICMQWAWNQVAMRMLYSCCFTAALFAGFSQVTRDVQPQASVEGLDQLGSPKKISVSKQMQMLQSNLEISWTIPTKSESSINLNQVSTRVALPTPVSKALLCKKSKRSKKIREPTEDAAEPGVEPTETSSHSDERKVIDDIEVRTHDSIVSFHDLYCQAKAKMSGNSKEHAFLGCQWLKLQTSWVFETAKERSKQVCYLDQSANTCQPSSWFYHSCVWQCPQ